MALSGDDDFVERLADAVRAPVFQLALGRRSCTPSLPVFLGVVNGDADAAFEEFGASDHAAIVRTVGSHDVGPDTFIVNNLPYLHQVRWHYRPRTVVVERVAPDTTDVTFDPLSATL